MRAAVQSRYGPPTEVFAVEEIPQPTIKDDEVLVRVRAAGVNWADKSMTLGKPYIMRLGYGLRRPRRGARGMDLAGTVEAVGPKVTTLHPGDEVFGSSTATFAEYAAAKATNLVPKPAGISFEQAGGISTAGCVALQAVRDVAGIQPGQKVLVVGASGGIGTFTVQIAKALGAVVTGVCSTGNVELVQSLGADDVIDYTKEDFVESEERFDMIIDMADKHTLAQRRRVMEPRGTLIPNSGEGGPVLGSVGRILKAKLVSPFVSQRLRPFLSLSKRQDLLALTQLIDRGEVTPVIGATYELPETGVAIAEAGSGHARGKIVVVP